MLSTGNLSGGEIIFEQIKKKKKTFARCCSTVENRYLYSKQLGASHEKGVSSPVFLCGSLDNPVRGNIIKRTPYVVQQARVNFDNQPSECCLVNNAVTTSSNPLVGTEHTSSETSFLQLYTLLFPLLRKQHSPSLLQCAKFTSDVVPSGINLA